MKIKSRFKDYYDYVAHAYGGGDERVTYVREPIDDELLCVTVSGTDNPDFSEPKLDQTKVHERFLVINGYVYSLISYKQDDGTFSPFLLFTKENFGDTIEKLSPFRYYTRWLDRIDDKYWAKFFARESKVALDISRQIKQPVFIITKIERDWKNKRKIFHIDKNIPTLSDYGIPHHIQAEQLYQEIAYYISNKMVTSPDLEIHDNMSDKEKVLQHGFDVKQSFRHRK